MCLLQEDAERQMFMDYVGQMVWSIDTAIEAAFGGENKVPQYIELVHPEMKKKDMSTEEVKQHILERMR